MENKRKRWRVFEDDARYVDRFGLLLVITALAVVTLSLVNLDAVQSNNSAAIGAVLVTLFVGATLLLALRASGVARRYQRIADVVIGIGVLATIVLTISGALMNDADASTVGTPSVAWITLAALAPIVVVRRLVHHKRATAATLLGALSAFLLIAVAFAFIFLAIDNWAATPFFGEREPTTSFMYFSLVTITTLGYGDLAAVEPLGRLSSTVEAVIGQVYLVTFVGFIVGLIASQRGSAELEPDEENDDLESQA